MTDAPSPGGPHVPIETLRYPLTRADAIAWETLPREMTGWRFAVFLVWLSLAGMVLALMPESWLGPSSGVRFWVVGVGVVLIQYGLATVFLTLMSHLRAARRIPVLVNVALERWNTHVMIHMNGSSQPLAAEDIGRIHTTRRHVFLQTTRTDAVIIPASAFKTEADMVAFVTALEEAGQDVVSEETD